MYLEREGSLRAIDSKNPFSYLLSLSLKQIRQRRDGLGYGDDNDEDERYEDMVEVPKAEPILTSYEHR